MLRSRGVRMNGATSSLMRAVTQYDVAQADCGEAVEVLEGMPAESRVVCQAVVSFAAISTACGQVALSQYCE